MGSWSTGCDLAGSMRILALCYTLLACYVARAYFCACALRVNKVSEPISEKDESPVWDQIEMYMSAKICFGIEAGRSSL